MESDHWSRRFIEMATLVGTWSKDPSSKFGAVIVRPDKTICSVGYNGFPKRIGDSKGLLEDREQKYARTIHSEMNAILHARETLNGYSIYVSGPPCDRCAAHIIQAGISTVRWAPATEDYLSRWEDTFRRAIRMYQEAKIHYGVVK